MSSMSMDPASAAELKTKTEKVAKRRRFWTFFTFAAIGLYLIATAFQLDLANTLSWNSRLASIFVLDTYAHKDHVTMRWNKPEEVKVQFEGGYRYNYNPPPAWFSTNPATGGRTVDFDNGGKITYFRDRIEMANWPGTNETFVFKRGADGKPYVVGYRDRKDQLPKWMRWTDNKIEIRPSLYERMQVYGSKVEVHRYEIGWKYFLFDFDSPLRNYSLLDTVKLLFTSERVDPNMSNPALILQEFLDNELWQHGPVLYAMMETILMAVIGTMLAALFGLPLAFLAAKNVTPFAFLRFGLRRLFDLFRGVDMLIWSIILLRAFGPGLFTGMFAIALTDTGTLGKLMSEAIENTDAKQREGIQSTGASKIQQHRFGVVPQILPIFISQALYYLESNTRGAVIIGAMGAGGIGLQFIGAIQTGTDWENVAYMALLVLLTVIIMDTISGWLRRKLIGIETPSKRKRHSRSRSAPIGAPATAA